MITGELKNRIDGLWDIFAAGGLVNPLDVIEQITYLMFIHDLDTTDNLRAKESAMLGLPFKSLFADEVTIGERKIDGRQLKWSVFHDFDAGKMYAVMQEWVFPFIKGLGGGKDSAYSKYMGDAIFKLPTPLLLSKVVDCLDQIYDQMEKVKDSDIRGDVYEYLLSKIAQSGLNGQFRTPRHIIKMMVELMQPKPDFTICDPACGTAGFLVASEEYLMANHKKEIFFDRVKKDHFLNHMFFGYDMDRTMLRIGAMNMMTHGVDSPFIEYRDSLSDQNPDKEKFDLILANPPFKGSLDADTVSADLLKVCKTKKTELLFLALFLRMLKTGGRCACIVPDGVLFGSSTAHKAIRKELVEGNRLEAVISMPSGVFKPYAGVSTGILIFTKTGHGGTDKVWFYDMTADGFSLDDKRTEIKDNDIPDIINRFRNLEAETDRQRTEKSFFVPKDEIVENGYDLSINKYKKTEYVAVEYPSTAEILADLHELEMQITVGLKELEGIDAVNFLPQNVDYTDNHSVKILATSAVHTADGFYELVKKNCKTSDPDISYGAHLEMYLALAGLSCEIYMKSIIYHENLHGGSQVRGHKLDDLFGQLPVATQGVISGKISNITAILPTIKDMFTTLRYDFEQNHIKGDFLVVFQLMEELRTIAHTYPQKKPGAVKYANGVLAFE